MKELKKYLLSIDYSKKFLNFTLMVLNQFIFFLFFIIFATYIIFSEPFLTTLLSFCELVHNDLHGLPNPRFFLPEEPF